MRKSIPAASLSFFFQAEDGIRDVAVTGVQTCALPIFSVSGTKARVPPEVAARVRRIKEEEASAPRMPCERWSEAFGGIVAQPPIFQQIGRASCRERV